MSMVTERVSAKTGETLVCPPQSSLCLFKDLLSNLSTLLVFLTEHDDLNATLADNNILVKEERVKAEGEDWSEVAGDASDDGAVVDGQTAAGELVRVELLTGQLKDIERVRAEVQLCLTDPSKNVIEKYLRPTCSI